MRNCGACLVRVPDQCASPADLEVLAMLAIHTLPDDQPSGWGLRKCEDHAERTQRITGAIEAMVAQHGSPSVVCYEQFSSKKAVVMIQMGHVIGGVSTLARQWRAPMVSRTPLEIKYAATGKRAKGVSKAQVMAGLDRCNPGLAPAAADIIPSRRDHPYDAFGAIVAAWNARVFMGVRSAADHLRGRL